LQRIIVIDPCGPADAELLENNLSFLASSGFHIEPRLYPSSAGPRLAKAGIELRAELLIDALLDPGAAIVLCARGGYGGSDLLPLMPWNRLADASPKLLVGFSDVSALQSALFAKLGWPSLHGPMPGSALWNQDGADVACLMSVLKSWPGATHGHLKLLENTFDEPIEGELYGGCFVVLGDLLGSGYMPGREQPQILFLEDVNESLPRLLRNWNQWCQTGMTQTLSAIVLGEFRHQDRKELALLQKLSQHLQERIDCPVFQSREFGHIKPNMPLMISAQARISNAQLDWSLVPN
jgi:muramoyltetrapeptide carboxypeptidase